MVGTPARWEAAGRAPGGRCKKSYVRVIVRRARTRGDPLALGEPALVAAIRALRGARASGGTCRAEGRRRGGGGGGGGERSGLAEPPAGRAHSASRGLADAILR